LVILIEVKNEAAWIQVLKGVEGFTFWTQQMK